VVVELLRRRRVGGSLGAVHPGADYLALVGWHWSAGTDHVALVVWRWSAARRAVRAASRSKKWATPLRPRIEIPGHL